MNNKKTVIFDLDGTLANINKRRILATKPNGKINWNIFHDPENISLDEPNWQVVKMAQLFAEDGFTIVIFSGRSDRTIDTTRSWLAQNRIPFHKLVMRDQERIFMPDDQFKKQLLDEHADIDDVFLVVDDRQKVVDMWRSLGLTTFQVDEGDF
jgi:hydroxymethylpyrimidine pyrophosphatase-like HAD family hydrolase